jgi:glycosyltransferase involved in cell wall biosynthesis
MVILEALASGLPVITSRAAGASEILEPGSGIVVNDENSVEEVGAAIARLVSSEELRHEMGRCGRVVAERYSWEHMAKQYMVHYHMLSRSSVEPNALPAVASDQVIHA